MTKLLWNKQEGIYLQIHVIPITFYLSYLVQLLSAPLPIISEKSYAN